VLKKTPSQAQNPQAAIFCRSWCSSAKTQAAQRRAWASIKMARDLARQKKQKRCLGYKGPHASSKNRIFAGK